jgi:signal transduction histidine kinase
VADASGQEIFRSRVQYASGYTGEYRLDAYGGLHTRIALNPALASSLLIGGLPSDRLPIVLSVLALTIALAVMGVMQLRREDELARLRSDFIASVSHELRTPLAQVRMFAETLLLGRVRSEEERARSLRIVDQEARRLAHLVENILQFSRAERQGIALAPVETELAGQVEDALESFGPVSRARKVTLEPSLERGLYAMVDPGAFRQILLNLLDNAVKYGPVGQVVRVGLSQRAGKVCLVVDDQGPGVPPRDRARVWEAFQRLESSVQSAVAGSGIGLAVVAELVALHGGRAWIDDVPDAPGARFVVELPLTRVRAEEALALRALPSQESVTP